MSIINHARLTFDASSATGQRYEAVTGKGQSMTLDSGPGATGPSPPEALLAALAACQGMDVVEILKKKRMEIVSYEISIEGVRRDEHPRRFMTIEVVHRLAGRRLDPKGVDDAIRLSAEKYCTVQASLAPDLAITSRAELTEAPA